MEASRAGSRANSRKRRTRKKWRWTDEQDALLTELVKAHGPGNWRYIADHIRGKTGMSCRSRWVNHLNPKVNKNPFSVEEQERLLELQSEYGNKWSAIVRFFPGRTDNQVKNQYHALVGTRNLKVSNPSSSTDRNSMGSIVLSPMPDKTKMPLSDGGSSSINGKDGGWSNLNRNDAHSFDSVNLGNMHANRQQQGDSIMSDARSAVISQLCPAAQQDQQEVSVKSYQFIDFLGVGNSD